MTPAAVRIATRYAWQCSPYLLGGLKRYACSEKVIIPKVFTFVGLLSFFRNEVLRQVRDLEPIVRRAKSHTSIGSQQRITQSNKYWETKGDTSGQIR